MDDRELQLKIDAYSDMLFKLSFLRLQNLQDAEDVVQEVFYQYVKKRPVFQSPEHEKAWFLKVALNGCRKVWRSAWRRHRDIWQDGEGEAPDTAGREADSDVCGREPEESVLRQEENWHR